MARWVDSRRGSCRRRTAGDLVGDMAMTMQEGPINVAMTDGDVGVERKEAASAWVAGRGRKNEVDRKETSITDSIPELRAARTRRSLSTSRAFEKGSTGCYQKISM